MEIERISNQQEVTPNEQSAQAKVEQDDSPQTVSIFQVKEKNMVGRTIQDQADEKLISITNYITKQDNKNISLTKTVGIFGMSASLLALFAKNIFFKGPKPSGALVLTVVALAFATIAGLVELLGGKEKRKANYTKMAAQTKDKSAIDFSLTPESTGDFIEKAGKILLSADEVETLSQKEIAKNAEAALGKDNITTRNIYFVDSKSDGQKAESILVADAKIKSDKYNGIAEDGIEKTYYEIPVEYSSFVKDFLNNKTITKEQADKFVTIIKALQTDGVYTHKQVDDEAVPEEDMNIFDLSGDGKLNAGDVYAAKLHVLLQQNSSLATPLADKENWDINKLATICKIDLDNVLALFDLNGDGNIDEVDYDLYKNIGSRAQKADVNADGKIDSTDVILMKKYVKGFISRYNNKGKALDNLVEIMGGEECMQITQDYLLEKEEEKAS